MNTDNRVNKDPEGDNIGSIAQAFFILGLLFIGICHMALLGIYFYTKNSASEVSKNHLKQTLIAASLSLCIACSLILYIAMTTGLASATALILIEIYLMLIIPLFMFFGIMGFSKAINHKDYAFPILGKRLGITTTP